MTSFGARLHEAIRRRGPLCVGIDPHPGLLADWGLNDDVAGLERFCGTVVEALGGEVAIVKPQSAFFERHGSSGIAVLERLLADLRSAGVLVLMDAKRGDIGSTVQAYADAYVDPSSPLCADAVTASPYLGFGSLRPLIDTALAHGNGVFVLARTSNPEGAEVQRARGSDGRTVAETMLDRVREVNSDAQPLGSVGCVVGATIAADGADGVNQENLRVNGPVLAPGIGAQGARVSDLRAVFGPVVHSVLPAVSREILRNGPTVAALAASAFALNQQVKEMLIEK
ncbi:orotidine-5'-phosphate decarboxylase [Phytoactinopolyspora halotolerans]|uniref:Orotidine 5'-phosphate decarboxylase n=1 Tax=Phytoactinopolyspora halotolerans TaxID=1981512 RepID=A0A6L9SG59_9ACTN|nr:orotidine-5'-phosphate decarboxylase [Phytoactinopolyspora halotolerans]NEE04057.1 orotidine-5'-phosphate decarboxylase [Phytoactinopolyspora halotolerans]